jgi:hypothetical protein
MNDVRPRGTPGGWQRSPKETTKPAPRCQDTLAKIIINMIIYRHYHRGSYGHERGD